MTPEFRIWDPDNDNYLEIGDSLCSLLLNPAWDLFDPYSLDFEQYTGLKDVNGNKIFEGDILKSSQGHTRPFYYLVKYSEQYAAFTVDNLFLGGVSGVDLKPYEVAGNIHNNPELLEVEE